MAYISFIGGVLGVRADDDRLKLLIGLAFAIMGWLVVEPHGGLSAAPTTMFLLPVRLRNPPPPPRDGCKGDTDDGLPFLPPDKYAPPLPPPTVCALIQEMLEKVRTALLLLSSGDSGGVR